jgi:hypothetical protein
MIAPARSTVVWSAVLALAACGSSPNNPPAAADGADGLAAGDADAGRDGDGAPEAGIIFDAGPNCPSSFTARAEGASCFKVTTACDYPEGRCACLLCEVNADNFGFAWSCRRWDSGGAGCPARSPAPGSACAEAGLECRYAASCSVPVGDDLECRDGAWQAASPRPACGYRMCPS